MDSAWAAQPEPSSGPSRTPPAGSRPRHRHRSGSTTPPPHRRAPAVHRHPGPQCPLRRRPVWQKRQGLPSSRQTAPPAKALLWAREHPRWCLRREGLGGCSTSRARARSSAAPPAPMSALRASVLPAERAPLLRHPTGTKPSGRAGPGKRHPAPGQRPAPASRPKEGRPSSMQPLTEKGEPPPLVGASGQDAWAGPPNRVTPPLRPN